MFYSIYPTAGIQIAAERLGLASTTASRAATPPIDVDSTTGEIDLAKGLSGATAEKSDVLPQETLAPELEGNEQISAADYNPDEDRKIDETRKQLHAVHETSAGGKIGGDVDKDAMVLDEDEESEYEEVEVDADEGDDFDMFSMEEAPKKKTIRRKKEVSYTLFP